ncbi:arsenate reductase [Sphingomonas sp.]|uniref:arsenate reductase n=1 Tax=Sphingomonas sp. TaxID=28214 RepID=UPI0025DAE7A2|nr:arsenate reductase [Sphingomonas sp.]
MKIILYGIPGCDTVKKARSWLTAQDIAFTFYNYKKAGIDRASLARWCNDLGWETVLNRAGTSFHDLSPEDKVDLTRDKAIDLMLANPSMIKRPVVEAQGVLLVGFKPDLWATAFALNWTSGAPAFTRVP